jgi:hypothetical protein
VEAEYERAGADDEQERGQGIDRQDEPHLQEV